MGTIANAKVTHYYNCYNGDFIGCLHRIAMEEINKRGKTIAAILSVRYIYYYYQTK